MYLHGFICLEQRSKRNSIKDPVMDNILLRLQLIHFELRGSCTCGEDGSGGTTPLLAVLPAGFGDGGGTVVPPALLHTPAML